MTFTTRTLATLSLAALMAASVPAMARPGPEGGPHGMKRQELLAKYDTNKDGKLDEQERAAIRADQFRKLDSAGKGQMTLAEFSTALEAQRARHQQERQKALFEKMDANKDGIVTAEEFAAFKPARDGDHPRRERGKADGK
ncbi:EF-hand domain-containing protein [Niveispirillum fermenti]|uniref:EF-hand domain-containing protein n=1 Tax=Niveispirillum fermenti TaxID=1233113 RepID=UPI003A853DB6